MSSRGPRTPGAIELQLRTFPRPPLDRVLSFGKIFEHSSNKPSPNFISVLNQLIAYRVMKKNPVKQALKSGGTVFGCEVTRLRSPEIPRLFALAGFDFAFIDMEHTSFTKETVADMIFASRQAGIVPVVRVPQGEYAHVAGTLDLGAQGIMVPRVCTREEVERIVSWTKYPPHGIRGFACTPGQCDDADVDPVDFIDTQNRETLVIVQIERKQALDNIEDMLSVEGIDVACLGWMDLSVDLGLPGQLDHPTVIEAVQRIVDVAEQNGLASGLIHPDFESVKTWVERGMRFASYCTGAELLRRAGCEAVRELQAVARNKSTA